MVLMNKLSKNNLQTGIFYLSLLFVFAFFYRISSLTPLAGDDWGYAINGLQGHPFKTAVEFYYSWSGRFFSELYGFILAPNKNIWNILNAFLFCSIYYHSLKISKMDKSISGIFLMLFLMLSVKDELRMETYTWLMGTTYVIPLALSLFYIKQIINIIQNPTLKVKLIYIILHSFVLFYIGLTMENIAVVMIFANICFILYSYIYYKKIPYFLYLFLIISILSFTLLRISPGANARLLRDHQIWLNYSLFEQIKINYPNFIRYTFIENRWLVLTFSGINILLLFKQSIILKKITLLNFILLSIFMFAVLISVSLTLTQSYQQLFLLELTNFQSNINLLFWPVFLFAVFLNILLITNENKEQVLLFLLLAGLSNGVMMASPIFGFRSSLYTVYFMFIVSLFYFKSLSFNWLNWLILLPLLTLIFRFTYNLNEKYELVAYVHEIRMGEITYYKYNANIKDAWLIRYPIYSIHSGDIEHDDLYHMEVFKEYYGLNKDVNLIFYYPENGYDNLSDLD